MNNGNIKTEQFYKLYIRVGGETCRVFTLQDISDFYPAIDEVKLRYDYFDACLVRETFETISIHSIKK